MVYLNYLGSCDGDSGGPLTVDYEVNGEKFKKLFGLVEGQFGKGECVVTSPTYFSNIAKNRDYILNAVQKETNIRSGRDFYEYGEFLQFLLWLCGGDESSQNKRKYEPLCGYLDFQPSYIVRQGASA